jgi:hypothetical protein
MASAAAPIAAPPAGAACTAGMLTRPNARAISIAMIVLCIRITSLHCQIEFNNASPGRPTNPDASHAVVAGANPKVQKNFFESRAGSITRDQTS